MPNVKCNVNAGWFSSGKFKPPPLGHLHIPRPKQPLAELSYNSFISYILSSSISTHIYWMFIYFHIQVRNEIYFHIHIFTYLYVCTLIYFHIHIFSHLYINLFIHSILIYQFIKISITRFKRILTRGAKSLWGSSL